MAIYNNNQLKKLEQKKINADIISKSRMQWINETKKLTSDFLNDSSFLLAQITLFCEKNLQISVYNEELLKLNKAKKSASVTNQIKNLESLIDTIDQQQLENIGALNDLLEKMSRSRFLIKLQFSNNEENKSIVDKVENITDSIRDFTLNTRWAQYSSLEEKKKLAKLSITLRENKQKEIEELVEILRGYYKKEWEKVKKGE